MSRPLDFDDPFQTLGRWFMYVAAPVFVASLGYAMVQDARDGSEEAAAAAELKEALESSPAVSEMRGRYPEATNFEVHDNDRTGSMPGGMRYSIDGDDSLTFDLPDGRTCEIAIDTANRKPNGYRIDRGTGSELSVKPVCR